MYSMISTNDQGQMNVLSIEQDKSQINTSLNQALVNYHDRNAEMMNWDAFGKKWASMYKGNANKGVPSLNEIIEGIK